MAVTTTLEQLTADYRNSLSDKHSTITQLATQLAKQNWADSALFQELHEIIHKLAGSAGSYGFEKISRAAIAVDSRIRAYQSGKDLDRTKLSGDIEEVLRLIEDETALEQ